MSENREEDATDQRQLADLVLGRFQNDQREIEAEWFSVQSDIPRRLYHYTDLGGLQGIVGGGTLWLTDVRFMNDSSELAYAADLIDEGVFQAIAEVDDETLRSALPGRRGFANSFEYGAQPFVACFCETKDLLSQWRGYGPKAGVCLGLDLQPLVTVGQLPGRTVLRKVVYDATQQEAAIKRVVAAWLGTAQDLIRSGYAVDQIFPYPAIWGLQQALAEYFLTFKHPAFEEEQEWRLIRLVDVREEVNHKDNMRRHQMMADLREVTRRHGVELPEWRDAPTRAEGIDILFRRSTLGLAPYVEVPLRDFAGIFTGRLPLWEVVQGPTATPELALESLRLFLSSEGYGFHTEVTHSGVPLRG